MGSWLEQLGAGGNTYRAGTDPYQEGGILPLLASLSSQQRGMGQQKGGFLGPIIEPIGDLIKMGIQKKAVQHGRGAGRQKGGFLGPIIEPIGDLIKMGFQKKAAQRGRGASGSKKKKKRSKYITGLSILGAQSTLNRLFRRAKRSTSHWGVIRRDFRTPSRHGITTSPPASKSLFPRVTLRKSI